MNRQRDGRDHLNLNLSGFANVGDDNKLHVSCDVKHRKRVSRNIPQLCWLKQDPFGKFEYLWGSEAAKMKTLSNKFLIIQTRHQKIFSKVKVLWWIAGKTSNDVVECLSEKLCRQKH